MFPLGFIPFKVLVTCYFKAVFYSVEILRDICTLSLPGLFTMFHVCINEKFTNKPVKRLFTASACRMLLESTSKMQHDKKLGRVTIIRSMHLFLYVHAYMLQLICIIR